MKFPNLLTSKVYSFFLAATLILPFKGFCQTQNHLLHSRAFNYYQSHQILPDGSLRVFVLFSDEDELFQDPRVTYVDLKAPTQLDTLARKSIAVQGSEAWDWPTSDFLALHLGDGSSILINNTPLCDVVTTGTVVKLLPDGSVDWYFDHPNDHEYVRPSKIVFLDTNTIGLIDEDINNTDFSIDRTGSLFNSQEISNHYEETLEYDKGYIARTADQLILLDKNFDSQIVHFLADTINAIFRIQNKEFFIQTANEYYLLDSAQVLTHIDIPSGQFGTLWRTENYYWGSLKAGNAVVRYNLFFQPLDTLSLPAGVHPIFGATTGDQLYVVAFYESGISDGVLIYKGEEETMDFTLVSDISITAIHVSDTVDAYKLMNTGFYNGWYYFFEYVDVEVTNFGNDTIHHFIIEDPDLSACGFCGGLRNYWEIDSLSIAPGEQASVLLGKYEPKCIYDPKEALCLHAIGPNRRADSNYLNDSHCQPFSIFVGTRNLVADLPITISPNPVSDVLTIQVEDSGLSGMTVFISDVTGKLMDQFEIASAHLIIPVASYPAGMYFLEAVDDHSRMAVRQFVIQH